MRFTRRSILATAAVGLSMALGAASPLKAQETIKVGILHSLSGTMAISETTLKDVMLMLIEEQNKKGGLLGKKLEPVVVDPASNWPLFAEKARELITQQKVAAVFGCWTSVSRKSVLPVFKELNSILFYPVQYEGEESERNVFYTGAAPNQQAIPAVDYLMSEDGGSMSMLPHDLARHVSVALHERETRGTLGETFGVAVLGVAGLDGTSVADFREAGATWWLESLSPMRGSVDELEAIVRRGPPLG